MLTQDSLKNALDYDPETGLFTWRAGSRGGLVAGSDRNGYVRIKVAGETHYAHRLAILYQGGSWPSGEVDHINRQRADNRICNLRDVSRRLNQHNRAEAPKNSKSGVLGVYMNRGRYRAQIKVGGEVNYLGSFGSVEAAHAAYIAAKREMHEGCAI
jgi:hypothetical protein